MRDDFITVILISTHTLRKEGDITSLRNKYYRAKFQPTPSARRVTVLEQHDEELKSFQPTPSARRVTAKKLNIDPFTGISTHTLRKEGDASFAELIQDIVYFNPHPPQGG